MSEPDKNAGLTALALVPIVCCFALPVLAAASIALAAWIGGIAAAVIALGVVLIMIAWHARQRRSAQPPSLRVTGSRS